jgi:hypothetical protein
MTRAVTFMVKGPTQSGPLALPGRTLPRLSASEQGGLPDTCAGFKPNQAKCCSRLRPAGYLQIRFEATQN